MRKLKWLFLLVLIFSLQVQAQTTDERIRISGIIIDSRTDTGVKRIPFELLPYKREVKTDNNGKFLLNLPKGDSIVLLVDCYPFDRQEIRVGTQNDTTLTILLTSPFASLYLEEVEVIASKAVNDKPASVERLDKQLFLTLPTLLGERDVLKALSNTAGVSASGEGSADMQVRGGTHGQNLYLMNSVPLYYTQHALGLISTYNPTIIKNATFYKAAFPAMYGGKVSSVLAVNTIEPLLSKWKGEIELGLISSKGMVNIPVQKEKLGIYLSGRISNFTPLLALLSTFAEENDTKIGIAFADINAGIKYKLSEKDELNVLFFRVADQWHIRQKDFNDLTSLQKINSQINIAANWERKANENRVNKLTVYADHFISGQTNSIASDIKNLPKQYTEFGFNSEITTLNVSDFFSSRISEKMGIAIGGGFQDNIIRPLHFVSSESAIKNSKSDAVIHLFESNIFTQGNINLTENQQLDVGIRASFVGKKSLFLTVEPRISYLAQLSNHYALSASLSRVTQSVHRVGNSGLGIPMEIFVPSNQTLPPEKSWIASVGAAKEIFNTNYRLTLKADMWYKKLTNIVEFKDGMDAYSMLLKGYNVYAPNQQIITGGKGNAYGIDCSLSYSTKKISFMADYTLLKATNRFAELNNGLPFAATTDITNTLTFTWSYKLKHNIQLSANWQFNSGRPITLPTHVLPYVQKDNFQTFSGTPTFLFLYTERNNYRTKPFHKLDISLTKNFLLKRKYQSSFNIGLYNAYNRKNAFAYSLGVKRNADGTYRPVLNSIAIFPVLPSFSWKVRF